MPGKSGAALTVGGLGLDCLVLALVLPATLGRQTTASGTLLSVLALALALCYWAADLLGSRQAGTLALVSRAKSALVIAMIAVVVVLPTLVAVGARRDSAPYRYIGDSAIEVEQDAGFLLHGVNYYARTFFDTPLARWWPIGPPNPALYHADKLPGEVVLAAAPQALCRAAFGWFDVRLIYLAALAVALALAVGLAQGTPARLAMLAGVGLNPLFVPNIISGNGDVLVLAEALAALTLARKGFSRWALLTLGLACATKYTVVPLVPFVVLWLAGRRASDASAGKLSGRGWLIWTCGAVGWVALPVVALIGPFLLWNARAYLDSTVGFIAGTVAHSFPMRGPQGYGVATFVLHRGLVRSAEDYFPFGLAQLVVGVPLMGVLLWRQWRANTLRAALEGYALVFLVFSYLARFFHGSHLAYGVALCIVAYLMGGQDRALVAGGEVPRQRILGLDCLVLVLLVPQLVPRPLSLNEQTTAAAAMFLLILYLIVHVVGWPSRRSVERGRQGTVGEPRQMGRRPARWRAMILGLLIGLLALWPGVSATLARQHSHPYSYVTDNAMQVEYATGFLLNGKNPYVETYERTPMARWYAEVSMSQALYHDDQLPLNFLLAVPIHLLAMMVLGWFDARLLYLPLYVVTLLTLWRMGGPPELRRARVAAVALGPFFVPAVVYGDTDVLAVAALVGAFAALNAGRLALGALLVGAALATKQTVVFLYPPFLAYLWGTERQGAPVRVKLAYVWRYGRWSLLMPVVTIAPFLLWNGPAFMAGTVGFVAGTVAHSYPIRGTGSYGFSAVVVLGKLVASPQAYYPFSLLEAAVVVPLLVALCRALSRRASVGLLAAGYAVTLGLGYYFSRFLQESGMGFILLAVALAGLASPWLLTGVGDDAEASVIGAARGVAGHGSGPPRV